MTPSTHPATWHDTTLTPRDRALALLNAMTPVEKLQQLGSSWPGSENLEEPVAPLQDSHRMAAPFEEAITDGIGHITRPFGTAPVDPREGMARLATLQTRVVSANRFGVPAIAHEECLTGLTAWKATVYPTSIAWAATFDPSLIEQMGSAIGTDMAELGVHQGLAPVLDVVRDYRWGRVEETLGEDPYLVSEMAAAYVAGLQSAGIVATLKHFVGYSASRGARNHAPVSVGRRELRDVLLIPFEKAIHKAGARSVMNSYTELDGVPTASDRELLTGLLRDEWGFTGTVVSDYWAVPFLAMMHRLTDDYTTAGVLALEAGMDVELPQTVNFDHALLHRVASEVLDTATLRVLTQKAELGLLDEGWTPPAAREVDLNSDHNRKIAARVAEESVVLLRNQQILPLHSAPPRIAVIGPIAHDARSLFGCYSFPNHVLPNFPDVEMGVEAPSVLDALRVEFPNSEITYTPGSDLRGDSTDGFASAVSAAETADLTVLVVGDRSGMFGHGTSGEGCDVLSLNLPGVQDQLAHAVLDVAKRSIVIVMSGRPYAVGPITDRADAAIQAFLPGQEGASAVVGVLSGRVSPSGRLPVQLPGSGSAQPGTYLAPPLALRSEGISNIDPTPAYPFGFGLSFTDFALSDVSASNTAITTNETVTINAVVSNVGDRDGVHVAQLYLTDPVAEVTRPVRQLIGFARVDLPAGASARIGFDVHADLFAYTGRDLRRRVDAGDLELTLAAHAADAGSPVHIQLTGQTRYVDHNRVMTATSSIEQLEAAAPAGAL